MKRGTKDNGVLAVPEAPWKNEKIKVAEIINSQQKTGKA